MLTNNIILEDCCISFCNAEIVVGFAQGSPTEVAEGEDIRLCVVILDGSLERSAIVDLKTSDIADGIFLFSHLSHIYTLSARTLQTIMH